MRTVGIDAHVLTGKFQGSRVWLEGVLAAVGRIDDRNRWIVYSSDPQATASAFPYPNFVHRRVPFDSAVPRLALGWLWIGMRDRLDALVTQYIGPPLFVGRQIVVVHDILFESHPMLFPPLMRWRNRVLVRLSARRAHSVLTPSFFSRNEIIHRYRMPAERVAVAPNGVTSQPPRDPAAEPVILQRLLGEDWNRPFLLFVGRIEPRKNLDLLLTSWRAASCANAMLIVVGRADFGAERTLSALHSEPRARHLVDVSPGDLLVLYRYARALVFPSVAEGFGIPILEALSVGTTVIHSNTTAMPEIGGGVHKNV